MDHNVYNELKGMVKEAMYAELTKEAMSVAGAKKIATEAAHKAVSMLSSAGKSTGKRVGGFFKADDVHAAQSMKIDNARRAATDSFGEYHPSRAGAPLASADKAQLHAQVKRALLTGGGVGGAGYAGYEASN